MVEAKCCVLSRDIKRDGKIKFHIKSVISFKEIIIPNLLLTVSYSLVSEQTTDVTVQTSPNSKKCLSLLEPHHHIRVGAVSRGVGW